MLAALVAISTVSGTAHAKMAMQTFPVLAGAGPHDVYPALDGTVWFTAQSAGKLGRLDPRNGKSDFIALGPDAAPHGVIVGPEGAAWVTEGGQNAIARVDPATRAVRLFPLPKERRNANLNIGLRVPGGFGMREGITLEVSATDRSRLEAIVAAWNSPQIMFGGRGSCC